MDVGTRPVTGSAPYGTAPVGGKPISPAKFSSFLQRMEDLFVSMYPSLSEAISGAAEAQRKIEEADADIARGREMAARADEQIARGDAMIHQARAEQEIYTRQLAEIDRDIAQTDQRIADRKVLLSREIAKQFHDILVGAPPLLADNEHNLYTKYLADGSFDILRTENNALTRINSMTPIIHYIGDVEKAHSPLKIQFLNFRNFDSTLIQDVKTLADFLKTAYSIEAIAFKSGLSDPNKALLADAIEVRSHGNIPLEVVYFD